jgi:hypothetical protein
MHDATEPLEVVVKSALPCPVIAQYGIRGVMEENVLKVDSYVSENLKGNIPHERNVKG